MHELKNHSGLDWTSWFWVDKEEFSGGQKSGLCRYHVEKSVGRDHEGRLLLMVWINHDPKDWHKFSQTFYALDFEEYTDFLDRAIHQGELKPEQRQHLIDRANAPFVPPWDIHKDVVVYRDERFELGQKNEQAYLIANDQRFLLTCHPYEPCLYITDAYGSMTAVHNAFEPVDALDAFYRGERIRSITGREYDAKDFCEMVVYAAGRRDVRIDAAEEVFAGRLRRVSHEPSRPGSNVLKASVRSAKRTEDVDIVQINYLQDDPFFDLIAAYPDSVIDYCIVKDVLNCRGSESHWRALVFACKKLFTDGEETIWHYDVDKAVGKQIDAQDLFSSAYEKDRLNYRKAFLYPPHENNYSGTDFVKINAVLFPNGTDGLDVYEWSTDWSEYFDEGHEWWGALCLTVYDRSLDRFVVILASATD